MTIRIAGCDLGKASASFVTATRSESGELTFDEPQYVLHDGKPFEAFRAWYADQRIHECAALGATGMYAIELAEPVQVFPEDACQEAALPLLPDAPDNVNLVSVGARGYGVLSRVRVDCGPKGGNGSPPSFRVQHLENEKCSSGTGENMQKIANRFGLDVEQADELARSAKGAIPITARCSVFAKSEMTHYANQGKPAGELFAGFFSSIARNAGGLLARNRVDGPVYLIGGCARIQSFRDAFSQHLGVPVHVPESFLAFEALGAVKLAAERFGRATSPLPPSPDPLVRPRGNHLRVLPASSASRDMVTIMPDPEGPTTFEGVPVVLGLDLGSTGAKAMLVSIETGEPVLDVYDRTRGNPVDASRRLVRAILDAGAPDVRAIGVTGSGRQAVATLLQAVFPEGGRVVVDNEIVAHATAAIRCDPDAGQDMSIIEIGGQDAKYVAISGGRIVDSDMNKACSAGTGSFLEEQAQLYDVQRIEDFIELALEAQRPPDLGQMCTVYVADAAADALREGFTLADIFAGFQYSIIYNYLDRVMGQRTLGKRVFFQGKPASNPSLAWTLAAVTGREIIVPPNPGAMGAWGIGLRASSDLGAPNLLALDKLDLEQVLRAEITERTEFACRDKDCQTLCPIERTTIVVGDAKRVALSGGACPKFEVAVQSLPKLDKEAPNPFDERASLLQAFERTNPGRPVVGIPLTGALAGYLPWLATFIHALGYSVKVLRSSGKSLARGEQLCNSFDSCSPTKIAHAICDADVPILFFPKILDIGDPDGPGGQTCVTEQAMPEMTEQALIARGRDVRVIRPRLRFSEGLDSAALTAAVLPLVRGLGVGPAAIRDAVKQAADAQLRYQRALRSMGTEALTYARKHDLPAVVVCGPLHVIHDPATNAMIPTLLRQNGAMAIPMDAFPIGEGIPTMKKVYWGEPNRTLRAAQSARQTGDAFPLMLSSFGCGPASFAEQFFHAILEGYPHTILESDGHGGTAGFVTRIQAFMHSVRQYRDQEASRIPASTTKALSFVEPGQHKGRYLDRNVRYVFLSSIEYLGPLFASVYRAYGYDAVVAPPLSKQNFELGRRDCSGKECLSYQFVWGSFREYLRDHPPEPGKETRLVQISGMMCRAGVFGVKDRISLDKLGLDDQVSVTALKVAGGPGMTSRVWTALCGLDVIRQLHLYHLAYVEDHDEAERTYRAFSDRILALAEQPPPRGLAGASRLRKDWNVLRDLLRKASAHYAGIARARTEPGELRTVFVTGDLMTKGSDFANGGIYHKLSRHGIRVLAEPACDFLEFLARVHPHLLYGRGSKRSQNAVYTANMIAIRNQVYDLVCVEHPWLPKPNLGAVLDKTREVLDLSTNGGAALAVGSAMHHWERGYYDGLVTTACWGCDNGLIGESLLRHQRDIPAYYFYDDATPIDERRLHSFAFRLHKAGDARPVPVDDDSLRAKLEAGVRIARRTLTVLRA